MDAKATTNPHTTTYSLNVDQKFPGKILFDSRYAGSHQDDIQNSPNLNSVPLGAMSNPATVLAAPDCASYKGTTASAGLDREAAVQDGKCQEDFRPYKNYQSINAQESSGAAQYDALQVSVQRSVGWATLNFNYAFAKGLQNNNTSGAFKDYGVSEYWGVSPSNRGHVFNAYYVLDLPKLNSANRLLRGVSNGWEFSGIHHDPGGSAA